MKTLLSTVLAIFLALAIQAGNLSGVVLYQGDSTRPINQVVVTLKSLDNNFLATYTTGPNGYYEFLNVPAGTYQLKGIKTTSGNGVNMMDALMVLFHIHKLYPFTDIQELAADVTGDGEVSMGDFTLITKHVLRNTPFPVGEWVFLNEIITVSNLKDSNPGGLTGSSAGDVGGIFVPGTRGLEAYPMAKAGTVQISENEPFTVPILTGADLSLSGAGLIINYPGNLVKVESVDFPMAGFEYEIYDNQIRLIWGDPDGAALNLEKGAALVTLHCTSTAAFTEGMRVKFTLEGNSALVSTTCTEITDAGLQAPEIEYTMPSFRLSNYPNPFTTSTKLAYYLPDAETVTILLYDSNGRLMQEYNQGELAKGYHSFTLEGSGLTPGSYTCKLLVSGSNSQTIRILKTN